MVRWAWAAFGLLVLESALGIFVNLFAVLPASESFLKLFTSPPLLGLHVVNGFLLVAVTAYLFVLGRRSRVYLLWRWALSGLLFMIFALQEGFAFSFTQDNRFSFGMEMGFLGAVVSVVAILFFASRELPADLPPLAGRPDAG